jgi:hypothetical protein
MLSSRFGSLPDGRQAAKTHHSLHDVCMSAVAMMFFQDPSLLQFQRRMEDEAHANNLRTLFHVTSIPKDTCMGEVLDTVDPERLAPLFDDFFRPLQRGKHLEQYQVLGKRYVVGIDGSQYFSSEKVSCPGCLIKEGKKVRYSHQIVQPALMKPGIRQVIPLAPEEVRNTDGTQKQDCEISAAKRLLNRIRKSHPGLPFVVVADSLYSKQPTIEKIGALNMNYVLVAKPEDHQKLTEWVDEMRALKEVTRRVVKGKKDTRIYEWINDVPLNDNKKTLMVNYLEYWIEKDGEITYHNSWVTDIAINEENVSELAEIGRCRWKIENETFNTLKNQGYHIEHNYGHGKNHLSFNFFLLNLLAFFMHQILELTYATYQELRRKFGSKKNLWDHLRTALYLLIFPDIDTYFERMLYPRKFT